MLKKVLSVQHPGNPAVNFNVKNVAVLGGSFDPPTISHLQVSQSIMS